MSESKKPSVWSRLARLVRGRPVTHEEYEAARHRNTHDVMTEVQLQARNQRYQAGGMF
jgi:hypothetical protein